MHKYSGYIIGFNARGTFSLSDGSGIGKNVIIFGDDISSLMHFNDKRKDILILAKGSPDGLDDTTLAAKKEYLINFTEQLKKLCLSLCYNKVNSYLFVNVAEIYKFKAKDSDINSTPLCLVNVLEDFSIDIIKLIMTALMLMILLIFINT